jgi:hypothetical protein
MGIAPEPPGDPRGVGREVSLVRNHRSQGLTYPYVRISSLHVWKINGAQLGSGGIGFGQPIKCRFLQRSR